jgi:DNA repair protein RadC
MKHLTIHDLPISSKPREKLLKNGIHTLSDAELIALIIGTGNSEENAVSLANRLLAKIPLHRLYESPRQLMQLTGIGIAKASAIISAFELAKRTTSIIDIQTLTTPKHVFEYAKTKIRDTRQEHFIGIYMDARKQVIASHILFVGTVDAIVVHPREIFAKAIQERATGVILVHNHPSGDPTPSDEDIQFTKLLIKVSRVMQIDLLDHVIIGKNKYYSCVDHGDI